MGGRGQWCCCHILDCICWVKSLTNYFSSLVTGAGASSQPAALLRSLEQLPLSEARWGSYDICHWYQETSRHQLPHVSNRQLLPRRTLQLWEGRAEGSLAQNVAKTDFNLSKLSPCMYPDATKVFASESCDITLCSCLWAESDLCKIDFQAIQIRKDRISQHFSFSPFSNWHLDGQDKMCWQ